MMFVVIPLGGKRKGYAVIDANDAARVLEHRWYHDSQGYPHSTTARGLRLHVLIMGARADHINGNKLDNRRKNLRPATQSQNCQNVRTAKGKYRGVYYDKTATHRPWYGQVKHDGIKYSAGFHATSEEARIAVQRLRRQTLPFARALE